MLEDTLLRYRFNRGDKGALPRIYEKYKHELVTLAVALLHDKSKAEDAVHDVFVALLEPTRQVKINHTLKGYLATAVANKARTAGKTSRHCQQATTEQDISEDRDNQPVNNAIFGEQKKHLIEAISKLPYEQREVILLRIFSGLKFKTIAKERNVSINTVQGRYRYGLEKLRSMLDGEIK